MQSGMLIVEDLMLLMLDDETGSIAEACTLHYTLGGTMLAQLSRRGRIEADESRTGLNGPKVVVVGDGPLSDPLLQPAYDKVAKRPRGVQTLLLPIGGRLQKPVIDRLVERGLIVRRKSRRVPGVFRTTTLPAENTGHEAELRQKIRAVLEDGERPDARTAAMIALLSASGTLPSLHLAPKESTEVYGRAKELEGASHEVPVSRPDEVTHVILAAVGHVERLAR